MKHRFLLSVKFCISSPAAGKLRIDCIGSIISMPKQMVGLNSFSEGSVKAYTSKLSNKEPSYLDISLSLKLLK